VRCPSLVAALPVCGHADLGVHDRRHLFFVEADHLRELTDFPTSFGLPLTSYPNLVFSIHPYTHKYTVDALAGARPQTSPYPFGGYDQAYATAEGEARSMGAALFVTEFGNEPALDPSLLTNELAEQERHGVGSTYWPWKENCGGSTWGVYAGPLGNVDTFCAYQRPGRVPATAQPENGCLRLSKERLLARPTLLAVAGGSLRYSYDSITGAFQLSAVAPAGNRAATSILVPREVSGATSLAATGNPDGSRTVTFTPRGAYTFEIAGAAPRLTGC